MIYKYAIDREGGREGGREAERFVYYKVRWNWKHECGEEQADVSCLH